MLQRPWVWLVCALVALPLTACSAGSAGGHDSADDSVGATRNAAASTPPIHVSQIMVVLRDGQSARERDYRKVLADCRKGTLPTQPLSDEVAGKLGRTFYDIWYEGPRMAERAERWDFEITGACQFRPVHESTLAIIKPGEAVTLDLIGKTGTRQPSEGVVREVREAAAPMADDDDAQLRAAVAAQLGQQGQSHLMAQSAGLGSAAGQPCQKLDQAGLGEACVWSGGGQWGFSTEVVDDGEGLNGRMDSILLWRHPPQGTGKAWDTLKMTVGEAIDGKVFEIPSGVAVTVTN
ncbi:hypothetical protein [Frateuria defendens]|uniref:hypothetical protein n=1 Tax=Frateuria defendens TaxID=2219559 RepID=UPI001292D4E4|nr:hypothetical protein [Frateuria defendens]